MDHFRRCSAWQRRFYAYYSYADPIMETITHLPAEEMTLVMIVAGGAMFFGNLASAPFDQTIQR